MKLLVVDECCFTRVGIASYFADSGITTIKCCHSIEYATPLLASFQPSHILVNLSNQCRYNEADAQLLAFMEASQSALLFIYLDTPYPYSETPMRIADNAFLFNKAFCRSPCARCAKIRWRWPMTAKSVPCSARRN